MPGSTSGSDTLKTPSGPNKNVADQGWDTYQERVLRNEGRLEGLEQLVRETREADRKLVDQRADSLAKELTEKATALQSLMAEQRGADAEQFRAELDAAKELSDTQRLALAKGLDERLLLIREIVATSVDKNYEQSYAQIKVMGEKYDDMLEAQETRSRNRYHQMEQMVNIWRETDREARELQATEYARRLDVLNGEHARIALILSQSVTRELFEATISSMTEKIGVIERAILTMPTNASMQETITALNKRFDQTTMNLSEKSDTRMSVLDEKLADQKDRLTKLEQAILTTREVKTVSAQTFGLVIAALGAVLTIIVMLSNNVFG